MCIQYHPHSAGATVGHSGPSLWPGHIRRHCAKRESSATVTRFSDSRQCFFIRAHYHHTRSCAPIIDDIISGDIAKNDLTLPAIGESARSVGTGAVATTSTGNNKTTVANAKSHKERLPQSLWSTKVCRQKRLETPTWSDKQRRSGTRDCAESRRSSERKMTTTIASLISNPLLDTSTPSSGNSSKSLLSLPIVPQGAKGHYHFLSSSPARVIAGASTFAALLITCFQVCQHIYVLPDPEVYIMHGLKIRTFLKHTHRYITT